MAKIIFVLILYHEKRRKSIGKIPFLLIICCFFTLEVNAKEKNLVNIYLFYSDSCPHCKEEKKLLAEIQEDYDNVRIYQYEVNSDNNDEK